MARTRNIKPGYFGNDLLAECDPLARILFAGLWCFADRAGRLEYRAKKIKAAVLPYDNCDIDHLIEQLEKRKFVQRYTVDGAEYLQVLKFAEHQNPHMKEPESTIPAPDSPGASIVQAAPSSLTLPPSPITDTTVSGGADAPKERRRSEKKPLKAFPADWQPDDDDIAYARSRGYDLAWITDQAERCRDHHASRQNKFIDFHAVWRTWVKRAPEFKPRAPTVSPFALKGIVRPGTNAEPHAQRLASFRQNGFWPPMAGPKPGERGCTVPDEFLNKAELDAKYGRGITAA